MIKTKKQYLIDIKNTKLSHQKKQQQKYIYIYIYIRKKVYNINFTGKQLCRSLFFNINKVTETSLQRNYGTGVFL